jgi:hypothetical protein
LDLDDFGLKMILEQQNRVAGIVASAVCRNRWLFFDKPPEVLFEQVGVKWGLWLGFLFLANGVEAGSNDFGGVSRKSNCKVSLVVSVLNEFFGFPGQP